MIARRNFLSNAAVALLIRSASQKTWTLIAPEYEVKLSVQYLDRYTSTQFRFKETIGQTTYCLGSNGQPNSDCLQNFVGSLAIVHFKISPLSGSGMEKVFLFERVQMIDRHERLPERKLFEQTIKLKDGIGSDIQAFGFEARSIAEQATADQDDTWCLMRQDLYLNNTSYRLLIAHWKHTLSAIRLINLMPEPGIRTLP